MDKLYTLRRHNRRGCTVVVEFDQSKMDRLVLGDQFQILTDMITWCEQNNCGRRISYDMFTFKNRKEMMLFMLRWS